MSTKDQSTLKTEYRPGCQCCGGANARKLKNGMVLCWSCNQKRKSALKVEQQNRRKSKMDISQREWNQIRANVIKRDGRTCQRCGIQLVGPYERDLTVDHITPISMGGKSTPDNLQVLCNSCNGGKGGRL